MSKPWGTAEFKRAFELEIRTEADSDWGLLSPWTTRFLLSGVLKGQPALEKIRAPTSCSQTWPKHAEALGVGCFELTDGSTVRMVDKVRTVLKVCLPTRE